MTDFSDDHSGLPIPWLDAGDAELWAEALAGGAEAFAVLFDRHRRRVFRHAYRYSASVPDAEDVVAVVFLETWRRRRDVTIVDDSLLPWLLAVAGFVLLNARRSARRRECLLAVLPRQATLDPSDVACARIEDEIRSRSIRDALDRLGFEDRRLVAMCIMEDVPVATAATALGIPLGTAKSRLHRAKAKLRSDPLLEGDVVPNFTDWKTLSAPDPNRVNVATPDPNEYDDQPEMSDVRTEQIRALLKRVVEETDDGNGSWGVLITVVAWSAGGWSHPAIGRTECSSRARL